MAGWSAVFRETFRYDWFNDDYHLIRPYTLGELTSTLAGSWDIDGLEMPGYRPGLTLLHHLRAAVMGESVFSQHVFQAFLMAAFLYVLGLLLFRLGLDPPALACLYASLFSSKVFSTHMSYLADGCQIVSGIFMVSSALALLEWKGSRAAAILLAAAAFSVKEDTYVLAPLLAAVCVYQRSLQAARTVLIIGLLTCAHFALRASLIEGAPRILSLADAVKGYIAQLWMSVFPFGSIALPNFAEGGFQTASRQSKYLLSTHQFILGGVGGVYLFTGRQASRACFFLMLACGFISALPGLVVSRLDLVLMPAVFFMAAFSIALTEIWRATFSQGWSLNLRSGFIILISGAYGLVLAGGVSRALDQARDCHPLSVNKILLAAENAYGSWSFAPVPEARRLRLLGRLRSVGIRNYQDARALARAVEKDWPAYAANAEARKAIFIPRFTLMEP